MARASNEMRNWALIGAEQRLIQLAEEIAAIHNAFPELRQGRKGGIASRANSVTSDAAPTRRRRRKMSAEARKRISEAQKKRWAKQKTDRKQ